MMFFPGQCRANVVVDELGKRRVGGQERAVLREKFLIVLLRERFCVVIASRYFYHVQASRYGFLGALQRLVCEGCLCNPEWTVLDKG